MASEPRINWTTRMDECLVHVLKEEHLTGGRHLDGTWKTDALARAAQEVNKNTGMPVKVDNVRTRTRYLKDKYKKAKECKEKSGFGWNPHTQLFTADDVAWKEFIQANPNLKGYRSKPVPYYDDMDTMYAEEKVTGLRSFEGSEVSTHSNNSEQDVHRKDMEVTSADAKTTHNENRKRKRWGKEENEERILMMGMIEAAKDVAAALRPQKCDKIELALSQLPDMTEDDILDGMDLLGPDPQLAEIFIGLSDERKKRWLWRKLKRIV